MIPEYPIEENPAVYERIGKVPPEWWDDEREMDASPDHSNFEFTYPDIEVTRQDVERLLDWERSVLEAIDREATSLSEFESLCKSAHKGGDEDDARPTHLDIGVVAACQALALAGWTTTYSCRGHERNTPGIRVIGDRKSRNEFDELQARTIEANCHLSNYGHGLLLIQARSVQSFVGLAVVLLDNLASSQHMSKFRHN